MIAWSVRVVEWVWYAACFSVHVPSSRAIPELGSSSKVRIRGDVALSVCPRDGARLWSTSTSSVAPEMWLLEFEGSAATSGVTCWGFLRLREADWGEIFLLRDDAQGREPGHISSISLSYNLVRNLRNFDFCSHKVWTSASVSLCIVRNSGLLHKCVGPHPSPIIVNSCLSEKFRIPYLLVAGSSEHASLQINCFVFLTSSLDSFDLSSLSCFTRDSRTDKAIFLNSASLHSRWKWLLNTLSKTGSVSAAKAVSFILMEGDKKMIRRW